MTGLLDTNVALYPLGGRLAEPLPTGSLATPHFHWSPLQRPARELLFACVANCLGFR
jgi:hypothetical protein